MAGHTRLPSGISKIYFRFLKRFPKEIEFETTQDRTEPISLRAAIPCTRNLSTRQHPNSVQAPSSQFLGRGVIFIVAAACGFVVANIYCNQPSRQEGHPMRSQASRRRHRLEWCQDR